VTEQKAKLEEKYGPSLSRSDIKEVQDLKKECNEILADKGAGKALGQFAKDYKKLSKKGEKITAMLDAYQAALMEKAAEELDQADELIEAGDFSGAKKIFASLKSALKKTDLAERIDAGYARIKELQSADE